MTSIDTFLTDHLDLWTSAIARKTSAGRGRSKKYSLHGIDKLRALILDLAVRGKLVPQDPNDEPASELLKHIGGKTQAKTTRRELDSELPPVPSQWIRTSFGAAFTLEYGSNLPDSKRSQTDEFPVFGSNGIVGSHEISNVNGPCLVVGRKGSAGAVNMCLADGCWVTDVAYYSVPPKGVDIHFAYVLFQTLGLDDLGKGIKPGLNRSEAYALGIAIPPLSEQHRIVAKVDELMALCDRLEVGTYEAINAHQLLVAELLATLTASRDPGNIADNWALIEAHFDTLFVTEGSVVQLKQAVIQSAVMGRLVSQDPTDEPSSDLLKRIKAEKEQLILSGAGRSEKPLSSITAKETPFELPNNWAWSRIGELALSSKYGTSRKSMVGGEGVPVLAMGNINGGKVDLASDKKIPFESEELPDLFLADGDILYNRTNSYELVGKTGIYKGDSQKFTFASYLIRIRVDSQKCVPAYINFAMNSPYFRDTQVVPKITKQTGQANVSGSSMRNMIVPVPPYQEQLRIVATIEKLMTLCDELNAGLQSAAERQSQFADAVVARAAG